MAEQIGRFDVGRAPQQETSQQTVDWTPEKIHVTLGCKGYNSPVLTSNLEERMMAAGRKKRWCAFDASSRDSGRAAITSIEPSLPHPYLVLKHPILQFAHFDRQECF